MDRPVIGDFRSKPQNAPRDAGAGVGATPAPATEPPPPAAVAAAEGLPLAPDSAEEAQKALDALPPVERYRLRLKEAGVTNEEAQLIYDAVLEKGHYEEVVYIDKARKHRAVLRTRSFADTLRFRNALDLRKPATEGLAVSMQVLYTLAATLYEWKGKPVPHETEADFDAALEMLRRLPEGVITLLQQRVAEFDRKTLAVFSDGAAENF